MPILFNVQGRNVHVRVYGETTLEERVQASDKLREFLAHGYRVPQNPYARSGKERFRLQRLVGVERELQNDELLGLEVLPEPPFAILGPGRLVRHLPDWELLNTWRSEFIVEVIDRHPVELPVGVDGRVRAFLVARHVRCLACWSQSLLEKYAGECPGLLKEPGEFGVPWAVDTVEFIRHFGDPKYPFMPHPWRPHPVFGRAA